MVGGAAAGAEPLQQGAVHLVGALSEAQMQSLHVSLDSSSSAQERLAALKCIYDKQQKFSGKV